MSRALHVQTSAPALPPMAHSLFCINHPNECRIRRLPFRGTRWLLTDVRRRDLIQVNEGVNRSIMPKRRARPVGQERWLVAPANGDCNDYAVTKRHELLERGWPSRTLLLAEVVTQRGEHHLVLVVRAREGDMVLDNLSEQIRPWFSAPYRWLRIQSPRDPKLWESVRQIGA